MINKQLKTYLREIQIPEISTISNPGLCGDQRKLRLRRKKNKIVLFKNG
jgi:hypothetical protein